MSSQDRRRNIRADRPHPRSRGSMILRFEPLEDRQVLSTLATAMGGAPVPPTQPAADLVVQGVQTETFRAWGDPVRVQGTVQNQGNAGVDKDFQIDVYVSARPSIDSSSVKIGTIDITDPVAAGGSLSFDQSFDLPGSAIAGLGQDQAIYIGTVVDATSLVPESNERNNVNRAQGIDSAVVVITERTPAQLVAKSFSIAEKSPNWGDEVTVTLRVENTRAGEAPATRALVVMTPLGAVPGSGQDVTIADDLEVPALGAFGMTEVSKKIKLPPGPATGSPATGGYVLWVRTDASFQTNPINTPVLLQSEGVDYQRVNIGSKTGQTPTPTSGPDLATADVLTPGTPLTWGSPFQVATTVVNRGEADSGPLRVRFLLGGPNGELTNALVLGDATIDNLKAGESLSIVQNLKLPSRLPFDMTLTPGQGRIVAVVDPENKFVEPDEANNRASSAILSIQVPTSNTTPATPAPSPVKTPTNGTGRTPTIPNRTPTRTPIRPTGGGAGQLSAIAAQRAERARRAAERRDQLAALRQSLSQRRLIEAAPRTPRGGPIAGGTQARANAPSPDATLRIFPGQ